MTAPATRFFSPTLLAVHFRIALRNILRHRRRSLLTVSAVAFGLFCLIVFQSLLGGLHRKMTESALGLDLGMIQIHGEGYGGNKTRLMPIPTPDAVFSALKATGHQDFAPRLKSPALILAGKNSASVQLSGIEPQAEASVSLIAGTMVQGSYQIEPGRILISKGMADSLGLKVGNRMTLMVHSLFGRTRSAGFAVGGLFATGLDSFDQGHVYLSLSDAQKLLEADGLISEIVLLCPPERAALLAERLRQLLPTKRYQIEDWRGFAPDLAQLMALNETTFRLLTLILFAIVALGIANTMTTVIFERFREFGTLTAIGATPGQIIGLVLTESLLLGLFSAISGSLAGLLVSCALSRYGIDLTHFTSSNQYFVAGPILKAVIDPGQLLATNLITLTTAILAGLYPALKAARLDPVKALAHN